MASLEHTVELAQLFADPTRVRLLSLLAHDELTVAELTAITEVSQSRVSTHLARLREAGLLRARRLGSATLYSSANGAMPEPARRLWQAVESELSDAMVEADRTRCEAILQARRSAGSWLDAVAGEMERHYSPGRTWESFVHGFAGLLRLGDVLDVGSGDGALAAILASWSKSVTCFDGSERMIDAARRRLASSPNVRCVLGDMHALPFGEAEFDQVALFNVLTYSQEPGRAVAEAARVLRRGGRVVILTLRRHEHLSAAAGYGHVQPGFRLTTVKRWLSGAGLAVAACNVVARERKRPHFEVILAVAEKSVPDTHGVESRKQHDGR